MNPASIALALLCCLAVAQSIGIGFLWQRYTLHRDKARTSEQALASCAAANVGQTKARDRLRESLRTCVGRIEASREAGQLALQQRDAAEAELDALRRQRSDQAEALYESDQQCAALRRAPVCSPIADLLREAARNR